MSSNDGYQSNESEVLELYNQGKSTRDIAKILRMSLRVSFFKLHLQSSLYLYFSQDPRLVLHLDS
jgi:DNA-binding CsgD family transcriptional regulator